MKAGARYIIRRNIYSDGLTGRVVLTAREEDAAGSGTDLEPAKSEADLKACKEWEASALRH